MARRMTIDQQLALAGSMTLLLEQIQPVAVRAFQSRAPDELKRIYKAFFREQYFNRVGSPVPIRPYGEKWRKIKIRRRWSLKKGWASGRLGNALKLPSLIRYTKTGYRFDLSRADKVVRRYTSRSNPSSFVVRKAPGLMNKERGHGQRAERAIRRAVRPLIRSAMGIAAQIGFDSRSVKVSIATEIDPVLKRAMKRGRYF